jgi:imidazolonepropionase-like amidohydrolase
MFFIFRATFEVIRSKNQGFQSRSLLFFKPFFFFFFFAMGTSLLGADTLLKALRVQKIHVGNGSVFDEGIVLIQDGKIVEIGNQIVLPPQAVLLNKNSTGQVTPGWINSDTTLFLHPSELKGKGSLWDKNAKSLLSERVREGLDFFLTPEERQRLLKSGVTTFSLSLGDTRWIGGLTCVVRLRPLHEELPFEILSSEKSLRLTLEQEPAKAELQYRLFRSFLEENQTYEEAQFFFQKEYEWYLKLKKRWEDEKQKAESQKKEWTEKEPQKPQKPEIVEVQEVLKALRKKEIFLALETERSSSIRLWSALAQEFGFRIVWIRAHRDEKERLQSQSSVVLSLPPISEEIPERAFAFVEFSQQKVKVVFGSGPHPQSADRLRFWALQGVGKGMDPSLCLQGLTFSSAQFLGLEKRIGSLQKGLDADMVLFNGDPCNSLSQVVLVLIQGEVVYEAP